MIMRFLLTLFCFFIADITFCQDFGGVLQFYRKGKQGLVDSVGTIILPAEYESIRISQNKKYIVVRKKFNEMEGKSYSYSSCYDCGEPNRGDPYVYYLSGSLNAKLDTVFTFKRNSIQTYKNYFFIGELGNFSVLDEDFNIINSVNY